MMDSLLVFLAILLSGIFITSTPLLLVSLGELITEKSGRINLGLEGVLVMGALAGFAASYWTGNAFWGVVFAAFIGFAMGGLHGWLCSYPRVSSIAVGIALMILGTGLAFYLGKPFIQPQAPQLFALDLGFFISHVPFREALKINVLFLLGIILVPFLSWFFAKTRWGLILTMCGENGEAAHALGYNVATIRTLATATGGMLAGIGGSFLSLYYPGLWTESLSSGQGLLAVALVIFSHWNAWRAMGASFLFGILGSLGAGLQSMGMSQGFHLFNAAPAFAGLIILWLTSHRFQKMRGRPAELKVLT